MKDGSALLRNIMRIVGETHNDLAAKFTAKLTGAAAANLAVNLAVNYLPRVPCVGYWWALLLDLDPLAQICFS
jgi:hypothetical protein